MKWHWLFEKAVNR